MAFFVPLTFICLMVVLAPLGLGDATSSPAGEGLISKTLTAQRRVDFQEAGRAAPDATHALVFAINQMNLNELEQELLSRATPGSPSYQQWLTYEEIGNMVTNKPAYEKVAAWLASIPGVTVTKTATRLEYIHASASVATWEAALKTEFFVWNDKNKKPRNGKHVTFTRCKQYSFPEELGGSLDHIFNTVQVPPRLNRKTYKVKEAIEERKASHFREEATCTPLEPNSQATPAFLNALYGITSNNGNSAMQQAVFETGYEYFSPNDLTTFQNLYRLPLQSCLAPYGFDTASCSDSGSATGYDCYEGNLDVQFMMAIAQNTPTIYYYIDDNTPTDVFVTFVTDLASSSNPPEINSISWGELELFIDSSTAKSFNTEAMKLGAMGVTVMVSSGDNGAPENIPSMDGNSYCACKGVYDGLTGYNPNFPASSPYVTAVGATQGPTCGLPETVCSGGTNGVITSGGGFSTIYTAPSWQTSAISGYFKKKTPVAGYDTNGRGYPDISLLGVDYPVIVQGETAILFGTSASSPVFGAMLTLLNTVRATQGLPKVGFINPTLYAALSASYYTDVTSGNNNCCSGEPASAVDCCSTGFTAASGWDPATGFGSITMSSLQAIFQPAPTMSPTISMAPSISPRPTATPTAAKDDDDKTSTSSIDLSSGATAGIAVGVVVVLAALGFAIFKFVLPNWGSKQTIADHNTATENPMGKL